MTGGILAHSLTHRVAFNEVMGKAFLFDPVSKGDSLVVVVVVVVVEG